jgi:hypothetical protein
MPFPRMVGMSAYDRRVTDVTPTTTCPPHHWDIGTAGRVETWVCTRCGETKVVDRRERDAELRTFTRGVVRKPDSVPPELSDIPAELTG